MSPSVEGAFCLPMESIDYKQKNTPLKTIENISSLFIVNSSLIIDSTGVYR
jgi:hypothetical protein